MANEEFEKRVAKLKSDIHTVIKDKPLSDAQVAMGEIFALLMVRMGQLQGERVMLMGFQQLMRGSVALLKQQNKQAKQLKERGIDVEPKN